MDGLEGGAGPAAPGGWEREGVTEGGEMVVGLRRDGGWREGCLGKGWCCGGGGWHDGFGSRWWLELGVSSRPRAHKLIWKINIPSG